MEESPLEDGIPETVQILTHPTLWDEAHRQAPENIREAQERIIQRTDTVMEEMSRLDW